jgi:hypothetical protein
MLSTSLPCEFGMENIAHIKYSWNVINLLIYDVCSQRFHCNRIYVSTVFSGPVCLTVARRSEEYTIQCFVTKLLH